MGIKFKQIDNLQETFDSMSGDFDSEITTNRNNISGIYSSNQTLSGWKYFANNIDISGQQGLLVQNDNIYTPNNLIAGGAKIGFPISTPRNSTAAPLGSLQVTGGQIYFEDQLNIRNNAGINIENGSITGSNANFQLTTSVSVDANYITGLTGNFNYLTGDSLNFQNINAESVDFVPTTTPAYQEGRLFYDTDNLTLTLYNDEADISLQVGQEEYIRVRNDTDTVISNGSAVRINGSQGTHPTVSLASADSEQNAQTIGLATHDIGSNNFGYITTYGLVNGLNTNGFSAGDEIVLSSVSGQFTSGIIESPNYRASVGHVITSHQSQGKVLVRVGQPKLGGGDVKSLSSVNVSGITYYDSAVNNAGILGSSSSLVYDNVNGRVGIGTAAPQAVLDVYSTDSSIIHPRLNTDQMTGVSSPVNGMIIYNTDIKKFAGYSNDSWQLLEEEWSPRQSTLNAWYDASDLSTFNLSGNYVSMWRDKSFKANHVTQSNTGQQPVAYEDSHNGLNVLDFSPNDNLISNGSTIENQDQTWLMLVRATDINNTNDGFLSYHDDNQSSLSGSWQFESSFGSQVLGLVRKGTSSDTTATTYFSSSDLIDQYSIFAWNFDRQNLQHSSWLNGSYNDSGVSDITGLVPNMNIKVMVNRANNQYPGGRVAEIICLSGALIEDKEKAEGYLAHKWNVTGLLPDSHPYKYIKP